VFFWLSGEEDEYTREINVKIVSRMKLMFSQMMIRKYSEKLLTKDYPIKKFAKLSAKARLF
jgi:hypothetical protein